MSFYIRKSLRFGPVRFNISKSGLGVSAGIKGFRVGSGPRGNYVHVGRGGLYYRTTLPPATKPAMRPDAEPPRPDQSASSSGVVMEAIDSKGAGTIVDSSSQDLVAEITQKRSRMRAAPVVAVLGVLASSLALLDDRTSWLFLPGVVLAAVAFVVSLVFDRNRKTTVVFYDLDDVAEAQFRAVHDAFEKLSQVGSLWHVPSKGKVRDGKYHAGADELVQRNRIQVSFSNPPCLKTNIPTPNFSVGEQTIYFFPERALIFDASSVGGLLYENLDFETSTVRFIETEGVPADSRVVDHTWRYVNKKGGPDRRFRDNRQIPIAEYESVLITSSAGVNELLHVSRRGAFGVVAAAIRESASFMKRGEPVTTANPDAARRFRKVF